MADEETKALGSPIRKPEMPKQHIKVRDGVFKGPDGKFYTEIPTPPPQNIWEFYGAKPPTP